MKMKRMLSTTAIVAAIALGTIATGQTAQAEFTQVSEQQSATEKSPAIKAAHLEHYNVLRLELEQPYVSNNSVLYLMHGEYIMIGDAVEKDGKIIAFDINTDSFARNYPNKKDKQAVVNSLHLMDISFSGEKPLEKIKVDDKFVSSTLMNAVDEGNLIAMGRVENITNITKLKGYKQFITKDALADNTLNKKATTQTGGIGFKYNVALKDTYTFSLTDQSGAVAGKVQYHANEDNLFVKPEGEKFLSKEYTISATSKATGKTIEIAKFTPFNLF